MKHLRQRRVGATALAAAMLAITACSGLGTSSTSGSRDADCVPAHEGLETVKEGVLTVSHFANMPFADTDGNKLIGAEGEILSLIAARECLTIEIMPVAVAGAIPAVQEGRADTTLGSFYRTAERAEVVRLSDPVITVYMSIAARKGLGLKEISDLEGHNVGSQAGTLWVDEVTKLLGDNHKLYDTIDAAYADFKARRIDAVLNSEPTAVHQIGLLGLEDEAEVNIPSPDERVTSSLNPGQTNFPTNLDNAGLQEALNDGLAWLRETGKFDEIIAKYGLSPAANKPEPVLDL